MTEEKEMTRRKGGSWRNRAQSLTQQFVLVCIQSIQNEKPSALPSFPYPFSFALSVTLDQSHPSFQTKTREWEEMKINLLQVRWMRLGLAQIEQAELSKTLDVFCSQCSARHLFSQTVKIMMLLLLFLKFIEQPSELHVYQAKLSSLVNIWIYRRKQKVLKENRAGMLGGHQFSSES